MTTDPKDFESHVRSRMARFEHRELPVTDLRAAAVCVAIAIHVDEPVIWLEERAATLRSHAGQFALPGGRIDAGETAGQAALRELEEELGVHAEPDRIVGRLDDFATRSGFVISPFVVWLGTLQDPPRCSPAEVARLHVITVPELDAEPWFTQLPDVEKPVFQWPYHGDPIHAPTAAILHQFREIVLHDRHTRVAHFEQPRFAWK